MPLKQYSMAVLLIILCPFLISAGLYKWTDKDGQVHFSDDPTLIPFEYRGSVEKMDSEAPKVEAPKKETPTTSVGNKDKCDKILDLVYIAEHPKRVQGPDPQLVGIYEEALKCFPESNEISFKAGFIFYINGKYGPAAKLFRKLYREGYRKQESCNYLIDILTTPKYEGSRDEVIERLKEAEEMLDAALKTEKIDPQTEKDMKARIIYIRSQLSYLLMQREKEADIHERKNIFEKRKGKHFVFHFDKLTDRARSISQIESGIEDILEEAYSKIGGKYNFYPKEPINVIFYTSQVFLKHFPYLSKNVWGVYSSKDISINSDSLVPDNFREVLFHEYTHLVVDSLTNFNNGCPGWLNEGLAEYEERGLVNQDGSFPYPERIALRNYIKWGMFNPTNSFSGQRVADPYLQSFSAAYFLINKIGLNRIRNLLEDIGRGCPFERCFSNYYKRTVEQFIKDLEDYINSP